MIYFNHIPVTISQQLFIRVYPPVSLETYIFSVNPSERSWNIYGACLITLCLTYACPWFLARSPTSGFSQWLSRSSKKNIAMNPPMNIALHPWKSVFPWRNATSSPGTTHSSKAGAKQCTRHEAWAVPAIWSRERTGGQCTLQPVRFRLCCWFTDCLLIIYGLFTGE